MTVHRRWSSKEKLLTQAIEQARTLVSENDIWATIDATTQQPVENRLMDF